MCPTVSNLYNNNDNNNCLFDKTIHYSGHNPNCFVHTQLHTRLTEFLLTAVCFVLPFYSPTHLVKRMFLKQKVRVHAFSRTLSLPLVYVHSHSGLSLMLVVVGLFGTCSMYLLVCVCVLCTYCLLMRFLSLCLRYLPLSYSFHT